MVHAFAYFLGIERKKDIFPFYYSKVSLIYAHITTKKYCNFKPLHIANSTKRDAVFFEHDRLSKNFLQAVMSLRHVDKNCRIILLMQSNFPLSYNANRMLNRLDAEIYFTNEMLDPEYLRLTSVIRRFYAEQAWLKIHSSGLDRVFHSDSTDVFFVGSPFNSMEKDKLFFVSEGVPLRRDKCNSDWVISFVGHEEYRKIENKEIINGGCIGGSCKEYKKFLDIFTQKSYKEKCFSHSFCDQPLIIWLIYTNRLPNIKYEVLPCSSEFAMMSLCKPFVHDSQKPFTSWYPFKVVFFHQFKYYQEAVDHLNCLCAIGNDFS